MKSIGRLDEFNTLEDCHTTYTVAVCCDCGRQRSFPNRCENFFCPECQPRLAADRHEAVAWWTKLADQPKHVVLTVKNIPDLTKGHVQEFKKWFARLRRNKVARNWQGGFYTLEVTNEGKGWHLHLHALVNAKWIDKAALKEAWARMTNGLGHIVEAKDARPTDYKREVARYVVKGSQLASWEPAEIATFIDAFTGVRTFGVFGNLYGARTKLRGICGQPPRTPRQVRVRLRQNPLPIRIRRPNVRRSPIPANRNPAPAALTP